MLGFDAFSNLTQKQMRKVACFNNKRMKELYSVVQNMSFEDAFEEYMFPSFNNPKEVSLCRMVSKFILNQAQVQQALELFLEDVECGKDLRTLNMFKMLAHTVLSIADGSCPDLVKISDENASILRRELSGARELKESINRFYTEVSEEQILARISDFKSCAVIHDSIVMNSENIISLYLHLDRLLKISVKYTDNLLVDALDLAEIKSPLVEMSDDVYDRMMNRKSGLTYGVVGR